MTDNIETFMTKRTNNLTPEESIALKHQKITDNSIRSAVTMSSSKVQQTGL